MLLRLGALTPLLRSSLFSPKPILLSPLITAKPFFSLSSFSTAPFQSSLVSHSFNPKPTTLFDSGKNAISVDPYYLSCCMADKDKPLRIAVLLSGGVDSSVALRLLHAAGHHCTAFYLKIWFQVTHFLSFNFFLPQSLKLCLKLVLIRSWCFAGRF